MEEKETQSGTPTTAQEMAILSNNSKKNIVFWWVKATIYTLIASFLISFAVYSLIKPNKFTIGGVAGIAILISEVTGAKQSVISLVFNLPLFACAFLFVRKRFAILSIMSILMQSLWLTLFEQVFPDFQIVFSGGAADKIFAAIAAGVCLGTALALTFKTGGSTGGIDILAVFIQRKVSASSISWVLFTLNVFVIGASFFVFYDDNAAIAMNLLPIMLSIFEAYIEGKTNESITNGFQSAREFRIITDKPEEMAEALMKELRRGVTAIPATGMYTKISHTMILCVVTRRQVNTLKRVIKRVDPNSFAVMSNAAQVLGLGFYSEEL